MNVQRPLAVLFLSGVLTLSSRTCCRAQALINAGDILAANYNGGSVLRIDPATGAQQSLGAFAAPTDVVMTDQGILYVTEWDGDIWEVDLAAGTRTLVNPISVLNQLWGIALGPAADVYVTSRVGNSVYRVELLTGTETLVTSGDLLSAPTGIELLDASHVVVCSLLTNSLVSVAIAGGAQTEFAAGMDHPWGAAVHGSDVYTTGYDTKLIHRVSGGTVTTVATAPAFPYGIDVEASGNIVAGLSGPDQVVRFSPQGSVLQTFSGGSIKQITGVEIAPTTVADPNADTDGDGMRGWEEAIAGTDPADPSSVLRVWLAAASGPGGGARLEWPSVAGRLYSVLRGNSLDAGEVRVIAGDLTATPPWNTYDDAVAGPGPVFYRIEVWRAP